MKTLLGALPLATLLGGCNTIQGLGKDVEQGGEATQRAVKK